MCGKLKVVLADVRRVVRSWRKIPRMHGKLKQLFERSCGRTEGSEKILQPHEKLTEIYGKSRGHSKSWWKVPQPHRKLWKVPSCTESWNNYTEGPALTEVDGKSCSSAESLRKVLLMHKNSRKLTECTRMHGKLTEVDERSRCCTKIWQNLPWTHGRLTKVDRKSRWRMKVNGWSLERTESWRKFTECAVDIRKVSRISHGCTESRRMVPWLHAKLTVGHAAARKVAEGPQAALKGNGESYRCTERWLSWL